MTIHPYAGLHLRDHSIQGRVAWNAGSSIGQGGVRVGTAFMAGTSLLSRAVNVALATHGSTPWRWCLQPAFHSGGPSGKRGFFSEEC